MDFFNEINRVLQFDLFPCLCRSITYAPDCKIFPREIMARRLASQCRIGWPDRTTKPANPLEYKLDGTGAKHTCRNADCRIRSATCSLLLSAKVKHVRCSVAMTDAEICATCEGVGACGPITPLSSAISDVRYGAESSRQRHGQFTTAMCRFC